MKARTIGIVGGGQLGRMLTLAAKPLGFAVVVVDPSPNCPAVQVGAEQIEADLYDSSALKQLAKLADFITVEIEHLDTKILEKIAAAGKPVNPSPKTIRLIQDKFLQKQFLQKAGVPVAPFTEITDPVQAQEILQKFGGKMLLKARHGAYDGRGNALVKSQAELQAALARFSNAKLYAEAVVPFKKELAVMVAKSTSGDTAIYPIVETIHARNICLEVLAPAAISLVEQKKASAIAKQVANLVDGAGVYGIEMFLDQTGQVLLNEIAPRVHNSGHYTMEACRTSQFEQHIRSITELPLGKTDLVVPAACMINILGERNDTTKLTGLDEAMAHPNTSVHIYGKSPTKIDRKMGHLTATANSLSIARKQARAARSKITI